MLLHRSRRTRIAQLAVGLPKSKSLMTEELLPLLDLGHAALAGQLMSLVIHLDVILREAFGAVVGEEFAVAAVEDVEVWVGESGVVGGVDITVVVADVFCGQRGTVDRVFAVENEEGRGLWGGGIAEELVGKLLLVVEVDGVFNVPAIVFIFKAAVDYEYSVVFVAVFGVQNVGHGVLRDARETIGFIIRDEAGEFGERMGLVNVHDGSQVGLRLKRVMLLLHHVVGVLKHAE